MNLEELRATGFEAGAKLCQSVIQYKDKGHTDMMWVQVEVPEYEARPLDEKGRRAYMQGFGEGIVSTIINE